MTLFRHCEEAKPTRQSRAIWKVSGLPRVLRTLAMTALLCMPFPAFAADDCAGVSEEIAGPVAVVRGMADYKAAMDAGYAACMVSYPQEFAPLQTVNDFMQKNMQHEMDQAQAVLDYLADDKGACAAAMKEKIHAQIDGQYKKSYARRHRMMSKDGLVNEDQDSCLIVLDMVKKYDAHYDDFKPLRYALYESTKKQNSSTKSIPRSVFKTFETVRAKLSEN